LVVDSYGERRTSVLFCTDELQCQENAYEFRFVNRMLLFGSQVQVHRTRWVTLPEEDCRRAAVVVSTRMAPPDCAALVVDRAVWQRGGAIALRHVGGKWEISAARPPGLDRPWARGRPSAEEAAASAVPQRREPRDATPRTEDVEPGD